MRSMEAPQRHTIGQQQVHRIRRPARCARAERLRPHAKTAVLEVKDLHATVAATGTEVLKGVNLTVHEGEVAAIMGKNGSGKSTLSKVLVGHPDYEVTKGSVTYKGQDLLALEPEERARAGLFLSFQAPIEVPGVNNVDFLRMAANARRKAQGKDEFEPLDFYMHLTPKARARSLLRRGAARPVATCWTCCATCGRCCVQLESMKMDPSFLSRNVNEGFSGGEKKRNEILQLAVLEPEVAILDEIDSGLDVDALRDVAGAVNGLRSPENSLVMITHYKRLLEYIAPDVVHVMEGGVIGKSGGMEIVDQLELGGYATLK